MRGRTCESLLTASADLDPVNAIRACANPPPTTHTLGSPLVHRQSTMSPCRSLWHFAVQYTPRHPFHGVSAPYDALALGSDLRRGCLPRLCCAFRLSQPLDALFHPEPSGLVSCRWRPWASTFGGFPLQVADPPLDVPSPPAVCTERSLRPPGQRCETNTTARVYASRRSVPSGLVLPGNRRSILP